MPAVATAHRAASRTRPVGFPQSCDIPQLALRLSQNPLLKIILKKRGMGRAQVGEELQVFTGPAGLSPGPDTSLVGQRHQLMERHGGHGAAPTGQLPADVERQLQEQWLRYPAIPAQSWPGKPAADGGLGRAAND